MAINIFRIYFSKYNGSRHVARVRYCKHFTTLCCSTAHVTHILKSIFIIFLFHVTKNSNFVSKQ